MKKLFALAIAFLMMLSMVACAAPAEEAAPAESADVPMNYITPADAKELLEDEGYVFFDIRKAADSSTATIPGALAYDMDAAKEGDAEAGKATMTAATEGLDKNIILVCYSGKRYAQASTNALSAIGYDMSKVFTLEGGFTAWSETYPELIEGELPVAEEAPAYTLIEDGKLLVALSPDFSPMEFVDTSKSGQDQYVGFDVTLAKFIAEQLGVTLEIKPMSFDACQAAVQMGAVDMSISGFSWTEERAANFCLSDYYYAGENETEQTIIVPADKAGTYAAVADFTGLKIGAQGASLQESLCNSNFEGIATVEIFKDINDAVLALKTGKIDGVAVATGNGEAIIANNPDVGMSGFSFEIDESAENNVIMLNKNSEALTAKVNEILAIAYDAGYYGEWYAAAQELAGIETAADVSYDDEGNVA